MIYEAVYVLMETVDLGGHPVKAYRDETAAKTDCATFNAAFKAQKIKDLMAHCGYTLEQAEAYALSYAQQFYLEPVELE